MKKNKIIQQARTLIRSQEKTVLSTHSASNAGFPFGSVTTYMTDYEGNPIIYISHLAQHTRNIKENPKLSLLMSDEKKQDINAGARLTVLGTAEVIKADEEQEISNKFYAKYPESKVYQKTHDFKFYRINIQHIRYIGGFGQIHWIKMNEFMVPKPTWETNDRYAIEHMNEDHKDAMIVMLEHYKNVKAKQVEMTHLYPDGCIIRVDDQTNCFLPYLSLVEKPSDIRIRLVELTKNARNKI